MQMMQPLDLSMIQGLVLAGWDVDHVFRMLIQHMANISNACTAASPVPRKAPCYAKFLECLVLLRHFQSLGELQIGIRYIPPGNKEISDEEASGHRSNTIQVSFPFDGSEKAARLAVLLWMEGQLVKDVICAICNKPLMKKLYWDL